MAALTPIQKLFVVRLLGCHYALWEVQRELQEQFGVKAAANQLARYNPRTLAGADLSDELKAEFESAREAFRSSVEDIGIAHKQHRLRVLDTICMANIERAPRLAMAAMKQAAMEEGGMFVRKADEQGEESADTLPADLDAAISKVYGESATDAAPDAPAEVTDAPAESSD